MANEADTCRKYVVPKLVDLGWDSDPHSIAEQRTFTDGRIVVVGTRTRRRLQKKADYLLRVTRDFTIAVVEAKADYKSPGDGMQQAKEYAQMGLLPEKRNNEMLGSAALEGAWHAAEAVS
jgi:type I restriction enzyme, R subunit